jgi:hypothetical protein
MSSKVVSTILVVVALPRPVLALTVRMNAIIAAMTASKSTFPSPPVVLTTASSHVSALATAEVATKTRAVGTIQARDDAKKLVIADAGQLHAYVQQVVNASPDQAATIAAAAAMTLRKNGAHPKSDLTVKQTLSQTVHVVAKSVQGARSHEWQFSTDGGKTWTSAPPTAQASTTIQNLPSGTLVQFRQRVITKVGAGDWTPPVTLAVS